MLRSFLKASALVTLFAFPAVAADYKCNNGRVEKGGSTQYTYKESSSEIVMAGLAMMSSTWISSLIR